MSDGIPIVEHETVGEHQHNFSLDLSKGGDLPRPNAGFNLGDVRGDFYDPGVIGRLLILDGFLKQGAVFVLQEAI